MNSAQLDRLTELELQYTDMFGHTYTALKARLVPNYVPTLSYAIDNRIVLTDSHFGLVFPPGAAQ